MTAERVRVAPCLSVGLRPRGRACLLGMPGGGGMGPLWGAWDVLTRHFGSGRVFLVWRGMLVWFRGALLMGLVCFVVGLSLRRWVCPAGVRGRVVEAKQCTTPLGAGCALSLSVARGVYAWAVLRDLLPHVLAVRGVTCRWEKGVLGAERCHTPRRVSSDTLLRSHIPARCVA